MPSVAALRSLEECWEGATPLETLGAIDPSLTWADLDELRSLSPLPLVLKGIQTAEDAELACEHGVDAIVVSNHGGRQLDAVAPTAELLPEIVEAVAGRMEVYVDGGIRRGSDVVKALALGARAVLAGRAPLWGLACDGEAGATPRAPAAARRDRALARALRLHLAGRRHAEPPRYDRWPVIETLTRNAVDVLPAGGLEEKLKLGRPLRVKLGHRRHLARHPRRPRDPAAAHACVPGRRPRRRLHRRRLHDADRRSRPDARPNGPILSDEEIDANAKTYVEQAFQIVDRDKTEVRFNSEWLSKLDFADVIRLTRTTTVAQILERDDFSKRMAAQEPISVSELLYPLMQAYDSVAVEADVELGGTDQLYNLLAGRTVMQAYGLEPQVVLTTPLLLSWDGEKMSSSVGNNIPLTAPPEEQFGRAMRIPDEQLRGVVPARARARGAGRRADGGEAGARTRDRRALARGGAAPRRRRRTSRGSCGRARRRTTRTCPRSRFPRAIRCICRLCWRPRSGSRRAKRGG